MALPSGPQPRVTCESPNSTSDEIKSTCNLAILDIFPDADRDWLCTISEERRYHADLVIAHIADLLEDGKSYPKKPRQGQKRKRSPSSEDIGEQMVKKFSGPEYRDKCKTKTYETTAKKALKKGFPNVKVKTLDSMFVLNDRSTFKTCLAVQKILDDPVPRNRDRILKKNTKCLDNNLENEMSSAAGAQKEALEELLAAFRVDRLNKDASRRFAQSQNLVGDERDNLARAKTTGSTSECGCCFEEFASNRMVYCNSARPHLFCLQCFTSEAERLVGLNKFKIECMSMAGDCRVGFPLNQILQLDSKLRFALERVEQDEAIRDAGLENLETCPFCPYAEEYPPIKLDKEFRCRNPDCGITSCRNCRFETHIPKTCAEAAKDNAKDDIVSARHTIEEAMSAAMIRNCNKCKTPFIKERGCNKMTCTKPSCGNVQCYICHKSCQYNHFDSERYGGQLGNCPLFDKSVEKRHQDEVSAAEDSARQAVMAENPELDGEVLKIKFSSQVEEDEKKQKLEEGTRHHEANAVRRVRQARFQVQRRAADQARLYQQGANAPGPAQHALVPAVPLHLPQPMPAQNAHLQQHIYPQYLPYSQAQLAPPIFNPWALPNLGVLPALPYQPQAAAQEFGTASNFQQNWQALPNFDSLGSQVAEKQGFGWEWDISQNNLDAAGPKQQQQRPYQQHQAQASNLKALDIPNQPILAQHFPILVNDGQQGLAASQLGSQNNPIEIDAGADRCEDIEQAGL